MSLIGIKLIDLSPSMRKGLAVVVVLLAITNATLVVLWPVVFPATAAQVCAMATGTLHEIAPRACANPATPLAVAGLVLIATLLACRASFIRGLTDVGFVGSALRGERARRNGL